MSNELFEVMKDDIKTLNNDKKFINSLLDILPPNHNVNLIVKEEEEEEEEEEDEIDEEDDWEEIDEEEVEEKTEFDIIDNQDEEEKEKEKDLKEPKEEKPIEDVKEEKIEEEKPISEKIKQKISTSIKKIKDKALDCVSFLTQWIPIRGSDDENEEDNIDLSIDFSLLMRMMLLQIESPEKSSWSLGFRYVDSIKNLDAIELEFPQYDAKMNKDIYVKDEILNCEAIWYLIPGPESEVFDFHDRITLDGRDFSVRKCYAEWKIVDWIIDKRIPLLLCMTPAIKTKYQNIKLSGLTIHDALVQAHTQMTYMAFSENRSLYTEKMSLIAQVKALENDKENLIADKYQERLENDKNFSVNEEIYDGQKIIKRSTILIIVFSIIFFLIGFLLAKSMG
jgi:hypothetical protein